MSVAAHYRRDKHVEWQKSFATGFTEPHQTGLEDTYSFAAENHLQLAPTLAFTAGVSFDWRDLKKAQDYSDGAYVNYSLANGSALNGQAQLTWTPDDALTSVHASVSVRSRFPTLSERFSTKFGGAVSNPDLKSERAANYEIGVSHVFGPVSLASTIFYSHLTNVIVAFPVTYEGESATQSRNLGHGNYYGAELALHAQIATNLAFGANYTYTHRDLDDPTDSAFQPTGVPTHKAFVWGDWAPLEGFHLLPNLDMASNRWTTNTEGTLYYRTGSYVLANLTASYALREGTTIRLGARNLFDDYYVLTDGFPERGRSFFLALDVAY